MVRELNPEKRFSHKHLQAAASPASRKNQIEQGIQRFG